MTSGGKRWSKSTFMSISNEDVQLATYRFLSHSVACLFDGIWIFRCCHSIYRVWLPISSWLFPIFQCSFNQWASEIDLFDWKRISRIRAPFECFLVISCVCFWHFIRTSHCLSAYFSFSRGSNEIRNCKCATANTHSHVTQNVTFNFWAFIYSIWFDFVLVVFAIALIFSPFTALCWLTHARFCHRSRTLFLYTNRVVFFLLFLMRKCCYLLPLAASHIFHFREKLLISILWLATT